MYVSSPIPSTPFFHYRRDQSKLLGNLQNNRVLNPEERKEISLRLIGNYMARCTERYQSASFSIKKFFIRLFLKITFMAKPCYESMLALYRRLLSRTDMQATKKQIAGMLKKSEPGSEYCQILQCIDKHLFANTSPSQFIAGTTSQSMAGTASQSTTATASQPGKNIIRSERGIPEPQVVEAHGQNAKLAAFKEEIRSIRVRIDSISTKEKGSDNIIQIITTQIDGLKDLIKKIENAMIAAKHKTDFEALIKEAEILIRDLSKKKALTELAHTESAIDTCKQAYREGKTSANAHIIGLQAHIGKLSGIYDSLDRISLRAVDEREQILAPIKNDIGKRITAEQDEVLTTCQKLMDNIKKEYSPSTIGQLANNLLSDHLKQIGDVKIFLVCFALFSRENQEKLKQLRKESQDLHEKIDSEIWRRIEVNECQRDRKIEIMQNKVNRHIDKIRNAIAGNTGDTTPYEKQLQIVAAEADYIILELDKLEASDAKKTMTLGLLHEMDKLEARQKSIKKK